ncbi:MAG: putative DNA binding domain-containing protein [Candidatus Protochlamydia sp.]|nr:putative DNA binding domain-containing protein [Candidatus Protochlamydia sp.]
MKLFRYPESESALLEFKREVPKKEQIIKTIIGFCNQKGGKLVLGVDDDRTIIGLSDDIISKLLESLDQSIYEACYPPIIPLLSTQVFGDKTVLIITVSSGMNKPYFRKCEGLEKGTYVRIGRSTVHATPTMIEELKWQSHRIDFEKLPVYNATLSNLDQQLIQNFLDNRKNQASAKVTQDVLRSYSLVVEEHSELFPTHAGILNFGKSPQSFLSEAMIIVSHFRGVEGRDAIASIDCEGTLLNQFQQAHHFILSRLSKSFYITGTTRDEKLEIPEVALREALINLLVHRNYHIKAPSKISIFDDRLEFFSPGDFSGPIQQDQLLKGLTYLRNPAICKIFRELGLVERMGTGFINIFKSYEVWGLEKPQIIEGANFIKCILPRETFRSTSVNSQSEQSILNLFYIQNEITSQEVVNKFSISRATAQRWLNTLIEKKLIERIGKTRNLKYRRINKNIET